MGSSASASAYMAPDAASISAMATFNPCFPTFFDVLPFLSVGESVRVASLSKMFRGALLQDHNFWCILCSTVSATGKLYLRLEICSNLADNSGNKTEYWRSCFRQLWQKRNIWVPAVMPEIQINTNGAVDLEVTNSTDTSIEATAKPVSGVDENENGLSINVCARFRPLVSNAGGGDKEASTVILPLHQKIAMIRQKAKIDESSSNGISKKEAFARLMTEMGEKGVGMGVNAGKGAVEDVVVLQGRWDKVVAQGGNNAAQATEKPLVHDSDFGVQTGILSVNKSSNSVLTAAAGCGLREFQFDTVMDQTSNQRDVFELNAAPLLFDFINGINVTMLMFGQTGSGKTYTMFGGNFLEGLSSNSESLGIVPRVCNELIEACTERELSLGITYKLAVSYIEIFGDEVYDLIRADMEDRRQIMADNAAAAQRFVLEGHCDRPVSSLSEVQDLLKTGEERKRKAATAMNEHSSRAHTLFILSLEQTDSSGEIVRKSKMFLADLGGSEDLKKSKVNEGLAIKSKHGTVVDGVDEQERLESQELARVAAQKERLKEAQNINYGLFALKMVIEALHKKKSHIPYHMSKLTLLLKEGLGGNSKTSVVVCAAPEPSNATESIQTLRFGEMCQSVKTRAKQTGAAFARAIKLLDSKIALCEEQIKKKERWATRSRWVESVVYDMEEQVEDWSKMKEPSTKRIVKHKVEGQVLVGAEEYREQLAGLLEQKKKLLNIG